MSPEILEQEKRMQDQLKQIITGLAHDLNNPNTFIRLNAQNLKKMLGLLAPCFEEYEQNHPNAKFGAFLLQDIQVKMVQQIESILQASIRILAIADKLKLCTTDWLAQSCEVSLRAAVQNTIQIHQFLVANRTQVSFQCDSESEPYSILGNQLQIEQALSILFTNANDAIVERFPGALGDGGNPLGKITIELAHTAGQVILSVSDNGCGMSESVIEKIFNPYFTTKPQGVGEGLGLAVFQSVIRRHQGVIEVKSQENQGTQFKITFFRERQSED